MPVAALDDAAWVPFASGLSRPIAIRHAGDGTGRLFVAEQSGLVRVLAADGSLRATPFLDLAKQVDARGFEQGLLGIAFHPSYAANRRFFVAYTRRQGPGNGQLVVVEYQASSDRDVAEPDSARTIIAIEIPTDIHNGGNILFGPDGYLYLGVGDGGPAMDADNHAQDPSNLLGSFLRLDVDKLPDLRRGDSLCGLGPRDAYSAPDDNPFVDDPSICDEIWTFGWRHPWRWSFDRLTGDLLIGDIGQASVEEISFTAAASSGGENYGWSCREGNVSTAFNPCRPGPLTAPVMVYEHDEPTNPQVGSANCAVIGGYRYRGSRLPTLDGVFFFGDYCSGRIWAAHAAHGAPWTFVLWLDTPFRIASFGEDEQGELYLTDRLQGIVHRLAEVVFEDGFEAGSFDSWSKVISEYLHIRSRTKIERIGHSAPP